MPVGDMLDRITIRPTTDDVNALGGFDQAGMDGSIIPAKIELIRNTNVASRFGGEQFLRQQLSEKILFLLTVRFRTDIKLGYVITDQNGQEFYVEAITNPDRKRRWTFAILEQGGPRAA